MTRHSTSTNDDLLRRIARYLMLHGSFCNNIGLLNGKAGIAIFFYHFARHTGRRMYDDFAGELLNEIYKEIHINTPVHFNDGLCGIAWCVEYLIKNRFVEGNPDDVLEESDQRIMEWDVRRITDYSIETGLAGIACYVISRMENRKKRHTLIHPDYIYDLIEALKKNNESTHHILIEILEAIVGGKVCVQSYNPVFNIIDKIKGDAGKIFEKPRAVGIDKSGYTGVGLKLMGVNKQ